MLSRRLHVRGGIVVNADGRRRCDVLVEGERVAALGTFDAAGAEVVDAAGCLVLPGGIDVHTHFDGEYMGAPNADDFETGGHAALAGGTTTHVDMCFQPPGGSIAAAIERWHAKAAGRALCDYGLHLVVREPTAAVLDELRELVDAGYPSVKLFTAGEPAVADEDVRALLALCAETGALAVVHAEDQPMIERATGRLLADGRTGARWFPASRPVGAETAAVARVLVYAAEAGAALHVAHVTCRPALEAIGRARAAGQDVSAETCPHYLALTEDVFAGDEPERYVCGPPIRGRSHRDALWTALARGELAMVSSDHGPVDLAHRRGRPFASVPQGLGTAQFVRALLWTSGIEAERMVELTAAAPARRFGLERKGCIEVGADADLVIWDPDAAWEAGAEQCHSAADYRVLDGRRFTGRARTTVRRGEIAWDGGRPVARPGSGRFLPRVGARSAVAVHH